MFLVDTNVLIDASVIDNPWFSWSAEALQIALDQGPVFINQIIYAEVSIAYRTISEVDLALDNLRITRENLPFEAGFLAGKAFERYRRAGGLRTSPLPDFYIGAHAAVSGLTLLTRDARRVRHYFPGVRLLAPGQA